MPNKEAVLAEISCDVPKKFKGKPGFLINVYGCSVFEKIIDGHKFIYTAVNNDSGESEIITRRRTPLPDDKNKLVKFALKVRDSKVGGLGQLEAGESATLGKLKIIVHELFRVILPKQSEFKIREEQIKLAEELLEALAGRRTLLAEAPTGLGKTLVYIIIGILIRRSKINHLWGGSFFPDMSCVEWQRMGILVSTSSIALQKAIHTEVIPKLSVILEDWGIIREPISSLMLKGKAHHLCEYKLHEYLPFEGDYKIKKTLEKLVFDKQIIDLANVDALTAQVKDKLSVPSKCYNNCSYKEHCRYRAFRNTAKNTGYDFVICNHQLLFADMKLRAEGKKAVLPPFQALIFDEAHKVLPAARSLYGSELSIDAIPDVTKALQKLNFAPKHRTSTDGWKTMRDMIIKCSGKLYEVNKRLFSRKDADEQCNKSLQNIRNIADTLHHYLLTSHEFKVKRDENIKHSLSWDLKRISETAGELCDSKGMIRWFDTVDDKKTAISGIPKDLNERLYADLWKRKIPAMLTSGTLSVGGDFTALKQSLGLDNINVRLTEVTHSSPFNYKENCLLYLSKNVPDYRADGYIEKLTDEIESLIKASNGHAAILFTSYKSMRVVHGRLKRRMPDMKDFVLERSTSSAIEQFKASGNGIIFTAGMWEGIDCPGDILSLLVIVKLPFAQPDAISEYEQTRYQNFGEYFNGVLMPDMLIKAKQGHGRGFRTENDTCVVAVCDIRANGVFREPLLDALPECRVTNKITEVKDFYINKKPDEYFN
jgi:ATP-dependent DNA helicase DinG